MDRKQIVRGRNCCNQRHCRKSSNS